MVAGAVAIWHFTPLAQYADADKLTQLLRSWRRSPWLPLGLMLAYLATSAVMFPNTVLNTAVVLALGGVLGPVYALAGSMLTAMAFYAVGRRLGERPLRKIEGKKIEAVTRALRGGGVLSVLSLRMLPVAPYSVVNVVAGAAGVRTWPYAIGTFLSLVPGVLLVTLFRRQLRRMLERPDPTSIALTVGVLLVVALALGYGVLSKGDHGRNGASAGGSSRFRSAST